MRPWPERDPERYQAERAFWARLGFEEERYRPDKPVAFRGMVTITVNQGDGFERHRFDVRVVYPAGFRQLPPRVEFPDPRMKRGRHQSPRNGSPCLFPEGAWDPDASTTAEFHHALERWLRHYLTGTFPRELAIYELPEYFPPAELTVLTPEETLDVFADRDRGGFTVVELAGLALAVLVSVDGRPFGRALLDELRPERQGAVDRVHGEWFRLPGEPKPFKSTEQLKARVGAAGHKIDIPTSPPQDRRLVGLIFTDAVLEQERLLILDYGGQGKRSRPAVGRGWSVGAARVETVSRRELFRRLEGVRDLDRLETAHVAVFGVGAIGSRVADALVREGLGSIGLYDSDSLKVGNLARHTLSLLDVGQPKSEAMAYALGRVNPDLETRPDTDHVDDPAVMEARVALADLIVAAIGDDRREQLLGDVVIEDDSPVPLLAARTLHAGAAWRVMLVRPGRDACLRCLAAYRAEQHPDWISVPPSTLEVVYDTGCTTGAVPGAGLASIASGAFLAARAVDVLEGRDGDDNHWLCVERPIPGGDERVATAPALHSARFEPRSDCAACVRVRQG